MTDPEAARNRAEWCQHHAATMAVYWSIEGVDRGVAAAINYAAAFGTGIDRLPSAAVEALTAALGPDLPDRDTIAAALAARAARAGVAATQTAASAAIFGMCRIIHESLADGARQQLEDRLLGGDVDFPFRCRRAAALMALGRLRDAPDMCSEAAGLAIRECREKPSLKPSVIFDVAGPMIAAYRHNPAVLDAQLAAEIVAVTAAMIDPDPENIGAL